MEFFNDIGGWHLVTPVVQSSRPYQFPIVTKNYHFVTWGETVEWTQKIGNDAQYTLTEWGSDTH